MKKTLYFLLSGWMLFLSIAFAQDSQKPNVSGIAGNNDDDKKIAVINRANERLKFHNAKLSLFKEIKEKNKSQKSSAVVDIDIDEISKTLPNYNKLIKKIEKEINPTEIAKLQIDKLNDDLEKCDYMCSSIETIYQRFLLRDISSRMGDYSADVEKLHEEIATTKKEIADTKQKQLIITISICSGCFILVILVLLGLIWAWDKKYKSRLKELDDANEKLSSTIIPEKINELQKQLSEEVLNLQKNLNIEKLSSDIAEISAKIAKVENLEQRLEKVERGGGKAQISPKDLTTLGTDIATQLSGVLNYKDHLKDLKDLNASISTAKGKLPELNETAAKLLDTIKKLQMNLDDVSSDVKKAETKANNTHNEILAKIKEAEQNLDAINTAIEKTAEGVKNDSVDIANTIKTDMEAAATTVANALQSVKDIQTKAIASVDEINEKALASLEDTNTKAKASVDEINEKVLASVEEINQKAMASIQDVNAKTEQINQASATLNSQMEGCRSREERLTRGAEGFGERLAELEKHITSLNGVAGGLSQLSQSLPLAVKAAELQQKLEMANGMVKVKEEEVGKQATEIQQMETAIQQKESVIQNKEAEIQQQKTTIQQKDTAIQQKDTAIQQKDAEIRQKNTTIQQKESVIQNKDAEIRQKDTTIQKKDDEIRQKDTTIQQKDTAIQEKNAEISRKNTTIVQKDAEIQQQKVTIQQKDDKITSLQADSIDLHSMYPKKLQEKAEYNQKFEELRTYARTENKEAKVCLHSIAVIGDILNNGLRADMKELLLRTLYDFSRNFTNAMSLLEGQQSEETLKSLSVWLNFFNEIGDGVFALNLPAKGELFANDWMTSGNSNIQRISVVESWAVFEPNKPAPWRKASVR